MDECHQGFDREMVSGGHCHQGFDREMVSGGHCHQGFDREMVSGGHCHQGFDREMVSGGHCHQGFDREMVSGGHCILPGPVDQRDLAFFSRADVMCTSLSNNMSEVRVKFLLKLHNFSQNCTRIDLHK